MAKHGESYPAGEDIRKEESQGEMMERIAREKGGIRDEDLLNPQATSEPMHREKPHRRK